MLLGLSMLGPSALSGASGPSQPAPPHRVLVLGDSLAVGIEPFLGDMLAGYEVRWDSRSGRTTPEGLRRLREDVPVFRPPRKGAFTRLNRVLDRVRERDERLTVVQWDDAVRNGVVHLPDGLHPDEVGYRHRSALFADAVKRGCRARA